MGDLYKARAQLTAGNNTPLSDAVITYLEKCFTFALYQNKDNENGLKEALQAIVPHAFGDHTKCSVEWCGYLKKPSDYKHVGLPEGRDLQGFALKKCLDDVIQKYTTPEMLRKIAPLSSSQRNEAVNSVIGTKSLKIRYYGGSESNDYRVAAGVSQVNEGKSCLFSFKIGGGVGMGIMVFQFLLLLLKKVANMYFQKHLASPFPHIGLSTTGF